MMNSNFRKTMIIGSGGGASRPQFTAEEEEQFREGSRRMDEIIQEQRRQREAERERRRLERLRNSGSMSEAEYRRLTNLLYPTGDEIRRIYDSLLEPDEYYLNELNTNYIPRLNNIVRIFTELNRENRDLVFLQNTARIAREELRQLMREAIDTANMYLPIDDDDETRNKSRKRYDSFIREVFDTIETIRNNTRTILELNSNRNRNRNRNAIDVSDTQTVLDRNETTERPETAEIYGDRIELAAYEPEFGDRPQTANIIDGSGVGRSKISDKFTKDEMTIIKNKNKEKKKKTDVMKLFKDSEAGRVDSLEFYDRLKNLSTEQQNAYRELQMTELNKILNTKTKGKGVGRSKVKVVDEFTNVSSGEIKPKPKTKGKRKVIDIMTAPVVSNKAREIQIQDKNKTRTSRVYVQPIDGKGIIKKVRKGISKASKATKLGLDQAVGFVEKTATKVGDVAEDVAEYGKAIIFGRNDYPPKVRDILKQYGEEVIVGFKIKRTPVPSLLTSALSAVSLGKFGKRFGRSEYDELFHLFLEMTTDSGKRISVEKNEVINMDISPESRPKEQVKEISNMPDGLTINMLMDNTKRLMGDRTFFSYSARDNNCQDFIVAILKSNDIGDAQDIAFVKQNTKELFNELPFLRKFSNTITDIGARVNVATTGAGISEKDYVVQSVVFSKDKWTTPKAKKWLKENNYKAPRVDTKDNTIRFRQIDPIEVEKEGFTEYRTKELSDSGIQLILSYKNKILSNNIKKMPRFAKGSEEAKEWGKMMREKRMTGGAVKKLAVIDEEELCPHCQSPMMEGGKININKQLKKAGKATKEYVTARKGGLATDVIKFGIPAASSALLGGLATAATGGNPVAGVAGSALGSKLGSIGATELQKATGTGMRKGRFAKGSQEAKDWAKRMREAREAKKMK